MLPWSDQLDFANSMLDPEFRGRDGNITSSPKFDLRLSAEAIIISHGLGSNWTAGLALDEVHPDVISANKFVPILNGLGKISQHRFQLEDVTHELAAFLCAA
ncbi:hypothetical protein M419DRAFT_10312 [Trichoderma reesei RUT C-30]|uniref:Uncharacterized protein n=1 Tax=Hypocrea jecorina (strain ATCC 56765 / BCRC 32924 / NRRL 11460 / Rut C-30) TaxID=1344414 RepID=A0A024S6Y8_HYPJR|nr:hypothetical protein M419DRAFT_10312 [Trichoderma reesei RUT C-30]